MNIGKRIVIARKNAGLTQMELAKRTNIPYQTIGHWERNSVNPKLSSLEKLADGLGISTEALIFGQTAEGMEDTEDTENTEDMEDTVKKNPVPDELPKYLNFLDEALRKTMEAKANLDIYTALRNAGKNPKDAETLNNIYARINDNIVDLLNLYVDART